MKFNSAFSFLITTFLAVVFFLVKYLPEFLWFKSFDLSYVWVILFASKTTVFIASFLVTATLLLINLKLANRNSEILSGEEIRVDTRFSGLNQFLEQLLNQRSSSPFAQTSSKYYGKFLVFVSFGLSVLISLAFFNKWHIISFFFNQVPYGLTDPIFGLDISFYFFSLPFYETFLYWLAVVLFTSTVFSGWIYFSKNILTILFSSSSKASRVKMHLFFLLSLLFVCFGFLNYFNIYELMFSSRGAVTGIGYTDETVLVPAYRFFSLLFFISAIVFFVNAFQKKLKPALVMIAVLGLFYIIGIGVVPNIVQSYIVKPNEINRERAYIEKSIAYTRHAYDLTKIQNKDFPVSNTLTKADIQSSQATMKNIRLWNKEPLKKTFKQLQEIRLYYEFENIDVDRYMIDGELQQVMLSPRELDSNQLDPEAQRWLNLHLMYTHGFGVVMSPVNEVSPEGLPILFLKDLPTKSTISDLSVTRPEIYFGEKATDYVIVNTHQPEFNYPKGGSNVFNHYDGEGGVVLDSLFKRLVYALKFNEIKILISSVIHSDSRILYDREIRTIFSKLAPFVYFDTDPYMVVTKEGRLVWMIDGYTFSGKFPYAKYKYSSINYIRNSVKATIDAYDGTVNFYISDNEDPLIQTISNVFPHQFKPLEEMPLELREHIRVPKFYFNVQADIYRTYHMSDPQVFYNREDIWELPKEIYGKSETTMESYYIVTTLPGEDKPSFLLMQPFSPRNKNNMIAWMSVKSDLDSYGEIHVYNFPKEKTIFGPMQIESRIDQDTQISKDLTLWGQVGSDVIRGNLMAIPIKDSLIYIEPIYLQATQSKFPELKRVVFFFFFAIVMEETLEKAVDVVFGKSERLEERVQAITEPITEIKHGGSVNQLILEMETSLKRMNEIIKKLKETTK